MPRNTSKRTAKLDRERRAWQLRCHGWTQERIASDLGIDQSTVSRLLARVWEREREQLAADVAQRRALASAQLEHLYDEAVQAWERSKLPRKRASRRTATEGQGDGKGGVPGAEVSTVESIEQTGDTGYYRAALEAWDRHAKLWGLDAPPKLAVEDESQPGSVSSIAATMVAAERDFEATKDDDDQGDEKREGGGCSEPTS